jgi:hypothetical protein
VGLVHVAIMNEPVIALSITFIFYGGFNYTHLLLKCIPHCKNNGIQIKKYEEAEF